MLFVLFYSVSVTCVLPSFFVIGEKYYGMRAVSADCTHNIFLHEPERHQSEAKDFALLQTGSMHVEMVFDGEALDQSCS